jgi:hypothetical protein
MCGQPDPCRQVVDIIVEGNRSQNEGQKYRQPQLGTDEEERSDGSSTNRHPACTWPLDGKINGCQPVSLVSLLRSGESEYGARVHDFVAKRAQRKSTHNAMPASTMLAKPKATACVDGGCALPHNAIAAQKIIKA